MSLKVSYVTFITYVTFINQKITRPLLYILLSCVLFVTHTITENVKPREMRSFIQGNSLLNLFVNGVIPSLATFPQADTGNINPGETWFIDVFIYLDLAYYDVLLWQGAHASHHAKAVDGFTTTFNTLIKLF